MNRAAFVVWALLAACAGGPGPADPAARGTPGTASPPDAIRLTSGEVVRGRIVEENARQVLLEREDRVSLYPRSVVAGIDYSKEGWRARSERLRPAESPASVPPPSSWYPRAEAGEGMRHEEVLWYAKHPLEECLGPALAGSLRRFPEIRLFAVPGGRIVLQDPRKWGYHAHVWPGDRLEKPAGKPGLAIPVPEKVSEIPEAIAFVSPAQEIRSLEVPERSSYAVPDALYAVILPVDQADGMLAGQPFSGGRPASTRNGSLWAFTLPRNSSHFLVYLLDAERQHGEILKSAFVACGDTVLAADLMIDVEAPGGAVVSRVLVVPFPDGLSADGPAPEPLVVCSGPTQDPTAVVSLGVPPRQAVQLPARPPSTRADILVSHYEVSQEVPQSLILAHGTGRPTSGVALVERELTPQTADEVVKIDLSSLPEERFPAVVWFHHRRTFAWRTAGGFLPRVPRQDLPVPAEVKLSRVKRGEPIPHVLPIYFQGPRPRAAVSAVPGAAAGVAGGMSGALMQDALAREAGRGLSGLTTSLAPTAAVGGGGSGMTSVTNVYITSPTHTPVLEDVYPKSPPAGRYMTKTCPPGEYMGPPAGLFDPKTGCYYDHAGQLLWDPKQAARRRTADYGDRELMFIDPELGTGFKFNQRDK